MVCLDSGSFFDLPTATVLFLLAAFALPFFVSAARSLAVTSTGGGTTSGAFFFAVASSSLSDEPPDEELELELELESPSELELDKVRDFFSFFTGEEDVEEEGATFAGLTSSTPKPRGTTLPGSAGLPRPLLMCSAAFLAACLCGTKANNSLLI